MSQLASAIKQLHRSYYIQTLFDPVQTHAVYGVSDTEVAQVKEVLKANGANRFRVVKIRNSTLRIVCYKEPK